MISELWSHVRFICNRLNCGLLFCPVPLEHLSAQIERIGGFECATDLREAYESIAYLIANRRGDSLRTDLNLCYPINYGNSYDIASFYFGTNQMLIDHIDINK